MEMIEFLLRKAASRSSCERAQVGAVALIVVQGQWEPVSSGWNKPSSSCRLHCPRYKAGLSGGVVPLRSSYDSGDTRCIAVHAEEMALVGVRCSEYFDGDWSRVHVLTSRLPCYRCIEMLVGLGVPWDVLDLDEISRARRDHPANGVDREEWLSPCPSEGGRA